MREIVTSVKSIGSAPSVLSIVTETSARPSGARPDVPAKMTSSIFPPRKLLAPCSPMTHESASTTLLLPDPFGPTTQVMPGSNLSVVGDAKDLKPFSVMLFKYTGRTYRGAPALLGYLPRFTPTFLATRRGWQRGQKCDERFPNAIRRISVPQREHGSPSWA